MKKMNIYEIKYIGYGILFGFLYSLVPAYINVLFMQKLVEFLLYSQFIKLIWMIIISVIGICTAEFLYSIYEYRIKPVLRIRIREKTLEHYVKILDTTCSYLLNNTKYYEKVKLMENTFCERKIEVYDNVIQVFLKCSVLISLLSFLAKQNIIVTICVVIYAGLMCGIGRMVNQKTFSFDTDMQETMIEKEILLTLFLLPEYGEYVQDEKISNAALNRYRSACNELVQRYKQFYKNVLIHNTILSGSSNTVMNTIAMLLLGYIKICKNMITMSQFIAYYNSIDVMVGNINYLSQSFSKIHLGYLYIKQFECMSKSELRSSLQDFESITLQEASLCYGEKKIFSDVNLTIQKGDKIAIIGRNGAGKSTLLKTISSIRNLTAGKIVLNGATFQENQQVTFYVPAENVFLSWDDIDSDFFASFIKNSQYNNAVSIVEKIKQFQEHNMLSEGEKKIIMLMHAFASEKEVLLLDEPFSNLDSSWKTIISELILGSQRTVVITTHELLNENAYTFVFEM